MADSDQAGTSAAAPEPLAADSAVAPPVPAPPPPPETVGQILRRARVAHGVTIEQLSADLRIEAKQLAALEEDRFEEIGVPVFVKGYLKQYGTRLGLDYRDLLAQYYKQTTLADVQVQPSRTIKLHDDRQITSWVVAAVVLLIVIGGFAAWWWSGGSLSLGPAATSSASPATDQARAAPAPQEPATTPTASPAPPPPLDTALAADSTAEPLAPVAAGIVEPRDDGGNARATPVAAIPLELAFDADSSAEVTDGRGQQLLSGTTAAGQRVTVRGEPPFAIVLGNADAVRLTVDGAPYVIPTVGREGSLARFSVDVAEE